MFVVFTVAAQMVVGFLLAMLFAKQFPLRKYLLILVLTPMMLSVVASGVFFTYYYDPTFGILSYVMGNITGEQFILMDNKVGCGRRHRLRRCLDVVALRHAAGAGRPRLGAEIPLRGRRHRPRVLSGASSGPSPSPISAAC
jgi:ABC-type sugar transport system permease subunit